MLIHYSICFLVFRVWFPSCSSRHDACVLLTWRDWADLAAQDCVRKALGEILWFRVGRRIWISICSSLDWLFASSFRVSILSSYLPVTTYPHANALMSKHAASRRIGPIIANLNRMGSYAASQISASYFFVPSCIHPTVYLHCSSVPV